MSNRCLKLALGVAIAVAFGAIGGQSAAAIGFWNMPGTFCQCMGYGNGPGYHAPLLLGPVSCDGFFAIDTHRLPAPPTAPRAWHVAAPAGCSAELSPLFQPSVLR